MSAPAGIQMQDPVVAYGEVREAVAECQRVLRDRAPVVQGGALAELVALWLIRAHPVAARPEVLDAWVELVRDLSKLTPPPTVN